MNCSCMLFQSEQRSTFWLYAIAVPFKNISTLPSQLLPVTHCMLELGRKCWRVPCGQGENKRKQKKEKAKEGVSATSLNGSPCAILWRSGLQPWYFGIGVCFVRYVPHLSVPEQRYSTGKLELLLHLRQHPFCALLSMDG